LKARNKDLHLVGSGAAPCPTEGVDSGDFAVVITAAALEKSRDVIYFV